VLLLLLLLLLVTCRVIIIIIIIIIICHVATFAMGDISTLSHQLPAVLLLFETCDYYYYY